MPFAEYNDARKVYIWLKKYVSMLAKSLKKKYGIFWFPTKTV